MPINVAIVGSGPAGLYTADALLDGGADIRIDIIERLPSPFGLIRFGVAPDHQTTKKISRAFEKTALRPEVRYLGNVEVGRDVSLAELREMYDAVVLAVGAADDRPLGIPGSDKKGVIGSASFVGWGNCHPDFAELAPDLNTKGVIVVGNGNVALDVARVLCKTPAELADSDLSAKTAAAIAVSPLTDVYLVGRRGPVEAKFTNVELREMGELEQCQPVVDPAQLPEKVENVDDERDRRLKEKNLASFREFAAHPGGKPKRVHFMFYASPVEVLGGDRVEAVRFERTKIENGNAVGTGEMFDIPCGLCIAAIGYMSKPVPGAPFDERRAIVPNKDGRVEPGLYAVGWIKRGPSGVISTNKGDGKNAATQIREDIKDGTKPGREALLKLLAERRTRIVSYADWQRIEKAEIAAAKAPAPRRKFDTVADMLAVLEREKV
jgi:NADPH-dependent glutamate synthase beta subunit-like oxidoreductase